MKKVLIIIGIILLVVFIIYRWISGGYNGLVTEQENVNKKWADVQGAYQRRADLIPNLVATVKQYANYEQQTLIKVIEQRANATRPQLNVDPNTLDEAGLAKIQKAQAELGGAIGRLLVVAEQYPQLKANENFLQLQAQLEGTENRINVERRNFNEAVQTYNTKLRRFPTNILAGMFGFHQRAYFQAEEGSQNAPKVNDLFKN